MTDQRLRDLFTDLGDSVQVDSYRPRETWHAASRRKRRRGLAATGGMLTAAAVAVAVMVSLGGGTSPGRPDPAVTPDPAASALPGKLVTWTAPPKRGEAKLPWLKTALPSRLAWDAAKPLSQDPPAKAVAVFQDESSGAVYVLGDDGRLRMLDGVKLGWSQDAEGNKVRALDPNSLGPDGTKVAFPQRDEVVIVDLTTGKAERFPVPGFNEVVLWRPGGETLLVEQESRSFLLNRRTGKAMRQPYGGFRAIAATAGTPDRDIVRIGSEDGSGKAVQTTWSLGGERVGKENLSLGGITRNGEWPTNSISSLGWRNDALVARTLPAPEASGDLADVVVVLSLENGRVVRALVDKDARCGKAGCPVQGWLGDDVVIIRTWYRLLGWNIRTGEVSRITELPKRKDGYPNIDRITLGDISPR